MSLHRKMAKGAAWLFLEKAGQQILVFLVFLVVARLVGPQEFGLANLCAVFTALAFLIVNSMSDSVISLRLRDDRQLSTLFWAIFAVGLLLGTLTAAFAAPIAVWLDEPKLAQLLPWFALQPPLAALATIPSTLLQAQMNFRAFVFRSLIATLISSVVGIALANANWGAYALAAQQIVMITVANCILWPACKWRPRLVFDAQALWPLLAPGVKVSASSLLTFMEQQAPRLIIGSVLGAVQVGYFALAARIFTSLREIMIQPVTTALYPALSDTRDDLAAQKRILSPAITLTGYAIFPVLAGTAVTTPLYVPLFFGPSWEPVIPVLQIFLASTVIIPFLMMFRDTLRAHNRAGTFVRWQAGFSAITLFVAWLLVPHGLAAMSWGFAGIAVAIFPLNLWLLRRTVELDLGDVFVQLWAPLLATGVMLAGLMAYQLAPFHSASRALDLAVHVVLGTAIYAATCLTLRRAQIMAALSQLRTMLGRKTA